MNFLNHSLRTLVMYKVMTNATEHVGMTQLNSRYTTMYSYQ